VLRFFLLLSRSFVFRISWYLQVLPSEFLTVTFVLQPEAKESIIRHLLLAGADPNALTPRRLTPLHLAACEGSAEIAQVLLSNHASPSAVDDEQNTPLHTAMKNSRFSVVRVLLADERTDVLVSSTNHRLRI
jgi:hypothetical protein